MASLNIQTTQVKKKIIKKKEGWGGQCFSLGSRIHPPFPHLRLLKKKKTVALRVKDCQKSPKAANSMLAGFELHHG